MRSLNSPQKQRPNEKAVSPTLAMLRERAVRLAHGDPKALWTLLRSAERVAPVLDTMPARWRRRDFDANKEV